MKTWHDAWRNVDVPCELFCIPLENPEDPDDMGEVYPDTECDVHWADGPDAASLRHWLHEMRMLKWRQYQARRASR